jgi:POLQ-like helicase
VAQFSVGANIPIRYLLITSPSQGRDAIKARDFHNLIGRAGRAGMYGEGTVVFTDHQLYDTKDGEDSYKWVAAQSLLRPESAEATGSTLLQLSKPLINDNGKRELSQPTPFGIVQGLIDDREATFAQFDGLSQELVSSRFTTDGLHRQLAVRSATIEAIESFLMTYRGAQGSSEFISSCLDLAKETFAYAIGSPDEQQVLEDVFQVIAQRIEAEVPEIELQARYGKSLFGLDRSKEIDAWVAGNLFELQICTSVDDVLDVVWPFLETLCGEKSYSATRPEAMNLRVAKAWLNGDSFVSMLAMLTEAKAHFRQGERRKVAFSIDALVSLCEHTFGYEFTLYIAGIRAAFYAIAGDGSNTELVAELFDVLQKRIKYGLPDLASVAYFEVGFSERVTAQAVAKAIVGGIATSRHDAKILLRRSREPVSVVLEDMPAFFRDVFARFNP